MNFHDLHAQYEALKPEIDAGIASVLASGQFILGSLFFRGVSKRTVPFDTL